MLLQIRDYLRREGLVSSQQLAREFAVDISALEPMLDLWINKKLVHKSSKNLTCGSACFKCRKPPEYYQWIG